jgi:uncharacterized protein YjbI with pentapeptide repeats
MESILVPLWIGLPIAYVGFLILAFAFRFLRADAPAKQALLADLPKRLATVTAATALFAGIGQAVIAAVKFSEEYAQSVHTERLNAVALATQFPTEKDMTARVLRISALLPALRPNDDASDAVTLGLMEFIRSQRSIDQQDPPLGSRVTADVQAAIRVLGLRESENADKTKPRLVLDFSRLALLGADFSGGDYTNAIFDESELRNANFDNAKVSGARFIAANFDYWCVPWALNFDLKDEVTPDDLFNTSVALWYPHKVQATFNGAKADGAQFYFANLIGVNFQNANLNGAKFEKANLTFVDLTGETKYQLDEIKQGCIQGVGVIKPPTLESSLVQCGYAQKPLACGAEHIWPKRDIAVGPISRKIQADATVDLQSAAN